MKRKKIPSNLHPLYDQNSLLSKAIEVEGVPRQIIVKNGKIVYDIIGFSDDDKTVFLSHNKALLEKILK